LTAAATPNFKDGNTLVAKKEVFIHKLSEEARRRYR